MAEISSARCIQRDMGLNMIPYSDDRIFNAYAIRALALDLLLKAPYNFNAVYPSYLKREARTIDFPKLMRVIKKAYSTYDYKISIYNHLLKWFSACDLEALNGMPCFKRFLNVS